MTSTACCALLKCIAEGHGYTCAIVSHRLRSLLQSRNRKSAEAISSFRHRLHAPQASTSMHLLASCSVSQAVPEPGLCNTRRSLKQLEQLGLVTDPSDRQGPTRTTKSSKGHDNPKPGRFQSWATSKGGPASAGQRRNTDKLPTSGISTCAKKACDGLAVNSEGLVDQLRMLRVLATGLTRTCRFPKYPRTFLNPKGCNISDCCSETVPRSDCFPFAP